MPRETTLTLVVQAKDATKRALTGARRGIKSFASRARSQFTRIRKAIFSVRGALTALAGAGAIAAVGKRLFDLGADAVEAANRFREVFGAASEEMDRFLSDWRRMAGLTRSEARDVAVQMGGLARAFGFGQEEAASFSEDLVRVAGDLASFNNVNAADAARAVSAALTGEREQLKRLQVVIRETDVQQKALAMTGKENAEAITDQEKALATLALIQERANVQMGDLERTQDSAANNARQLAGAFRDAKEALGEALLPVFADLMGVVTENEEQWTALGDRIRENRREIQDFVRTFLRLGGAIGRTFVTAGQLIGDFVLAAKNAIEGGFRLLVANLMEAVNFAVRGLNRLIEGANEIPGVDIDFRVNELPAQEWADSSAEDIRIVNTALGEMGSNLSAAADAWSQVGDEAERAKEKQEEAAQAGQQAGGPGSGGGGGGLDTEGFSPFTAGVGGEVAGGRGGGMDLISGRDFTVEELKDFARMDSEGVDVTPVENLLSAWQRVGFEIMKVTQNQRTMAEVMAQITKQFVSGFANAFSQAAQAAVTGSKSIGAAFKGAMLNAVASVAEAMSQFYAAKAAAAVGEGLLGHPGGFAAAAKFTAAAAAFGALAGILRGVAQGGGGGAGAAAQAGTTSTQRGLEEDQGGDRTVIVKGGLINLNDPQQRRQLERAINGGSQLGSIRFVSG